MNAAIESTYRENTYKLQEFTNSNPKMDKGLIIEEPLKEVGKKDIPEKESKQENQKIRENMMMDLSEVKNFLFMLIGAEIKIESENSQSGRMFNTLA